MPRRAERKISMKYIAKLYHNGIVYRYHINEYGEVVRTGDGHSIYYPDWSGDILSEDLEYMAILYMSRDTISFYLNDEDVRDWFKDYGDVAERIREYKISRQPKHTYIISVTSPDPERNAELKRLKLDRMIERFHNRKEAEAFCRDLNHTGAFCFYREKATVEGRRS